MRVSLLARGAVLAAAGLLAACTDAAPDRVIAPATPAFGKNVTGSNQRILYSGDVGAAGNLDIYSMNPDASSLVRLTTGSSYDAFPVWSPDGKRVAFSSNRDRPDFDIYVMNADGTNVVRLTVGPGTNTMPSWSKDGKQIVFTSTRDAANPDLFDMADYEVYVMNADGTGIERLTDNHYMDGEAVWSPDGRQIAFVSGRDHPGTGVNDMYIMNVDGTNVTRLTNQSETLAYLSWDPHGKRIAFSLDPDSPSAGIYTIASNGSGQVRLTSSVDTGPSWSADGSKLAYTCSISGSTQVCEINADGTGRVLLTTVGQHNQVRWSR